MSKIKKIQVINYNNARAFIKEFKELNKDCDIPSLVWMDIYAKNMSMFNTEEPNTEDEEVIQYLLNTLSEFYTISEAGSELRYSLENRDKFKDITEKYEGFEW